MLLLSAPIPTPQAGQPRFQARPRRGSSPSPCSTCSVAPGIGPLRDAVSQEFWPDIWQHVGPPWAKASPAAVPPISLGSQGHLGVSGLLRATRAHATLLRVGGLLVPQGECPGRQALSLRGFSHSSGAGRRTRWSSRSLPGVCGCGLCTAQGGGSRCAAQLSRLLVLKLLGQQMLTEPNHVWALPPRSVQSSSISDRTGGSDPRQGVYWGWRGDCDGVSEWRAPFSCSCPYSPPPQPPHHPPKSWSELFRSAGCTLISRVPAGLDAGSDSAGLDP